MEEISKNHLDKVCQIFATFRSIEDIEDILNDVCTRKELEAIYQRFRVAQMLKQGLTFTQIEEKTGISSTTITRVSKCLQKGNGYNKLFDKYKLTINIEE